MPIKLLFPESKEGGVGLGRQAGTQEKGREKDGDSRVHLRFPGQTSSPSSLNAPGEVVGSMRFKGAADSVLPHLDLTVWLGSRVRTLTLGIHEILCYDGSFCKCSGKPAEGKSNNIWGQLEGFTEEEEQQQEEETQDGEKQVLVEGGHPSLLSPPRQ